MGSDTLSKVNIVCTLKSNENIYKFKGKGIIKNNVITYNDNDIITKIILDDIIWLKRKKDYEITLGFCNGKKVKGSYIINGNKMTTETTTYHVNKSQNSIRIKYFLNINNTLIDKFELNFKYTIDSI